MRFIPTRIHAILDYLGGIVLIALPFLFGFESEAATWIMVILGVGVLLYSAMTDYELGLVRKLPMPGHLAMDGIGGVLLLVSPWLFGFADVDPWWLFVLLGVGEICAALCTHTVPDDEIAHVGAAGDHAHDTHRGVREARG